MTDPMQAAIEAAAEATEQHHIEFGKTDAMGNNPCVCGQWWDSDSMPGWDEHMAEAAYAAIEPLVRKAVADELRQAVAEQSSWLWFELGESALLKVADHIAPRGERA